ncbi:MAG: hypothetical protein DMG13_07895 [Acidobacteria bacterium]|nr:MAG: hypothetical protein DMG13_07895 [Acidobacteriota bacterium]
MPASPGEVESSDLHIVAICHLRPWNCNLQIDLWTGPGFRRQRCPPAKCLRHEWLTIETDMRLVPDLEAAPT